MEYQAAYDMLAAMRLVMEPVELCSLAQMLGKANSADVYR